MKAQLLPVFAAIFVLFCSCGSDQKISREVFEEVQQANEVKRLSEVDIFNEALKWGEEISAKAQNQLMTNLEKAIEEKGADAAMEFCNTQVVKILKEIGDQYGVTIRRVSNYSTNSADQPLEEEKMLLEAYQYNEQNNVKHEPNLQKIKDGSVLLFTKAITNPDGLCLHFYGNPDKDIDEKTLQKLTPSYSEDRGHELGDLQGMWSIAIPQREVVKRL